MVSQKYKSFHKKVFSIRTMSWIYVESTRIGFCIYLKGSTKFPGRVLPNKYIWIVMYKLYRRYFRWNMCEGKFSVWWISHYFTAWRRIQIGSRIISIELLSMFFVNMAFKMFFSCELHFTKLTLMSKVGLVHLAVMPSKWCPLHKTFFAFGALIVLLSAI